MTPWPYDPEPDAITNRPSPPVPPWELPGGYRRDCEPHRAGALRVLGLLSEAAGSRSLLALLAALRAVCPPPKTPAVPGAWLAPGVACAALALAGLVLGVT